MPLAVKLKFDANVVRTTGQRTSLLQVQHNPAVRSALWEILGDEPVARFTAFLATSPGATDAYRHEDGNPHLHIVGVDSRPEGKRLIVWAPIDDVRSEAGPMWVLPGSHRRFSHFADELMNATPEMLADLQRMWAEGATAEEWMTWNARLYPHALAILKEYVRECGIARHPLLLARGDAVIFSNALLHGTFLSEDPSISRRAFYTHYHSRSCEPWDLGDGIGSHANRHRIQPHPDSSGTRTTYGLVYPESVLNYFHSLKGCLID